jgi:hypothetical protein
MRDNTFINFTSICSCLHTTSLSHDYTLISLIVSRRTLSLLRDDSGDGLRRRDDGDDGDAVNCWGCTTILLKFGERTKGRLGPGRLCVVPTHFPYNICTCYAASLASLYYSKSHSVSLPSRIKQVIIKHNEKKIKERLLNENHHKRWTKCRLVYYQDFGWQKKLKVWVRAAATVFVLWNTA